jgi:hypothetical protein
MIDELFALLADEPRRRVLVSLLHVEGESVPVGDAALKRGAAAHTGGGADVGPSGAPGSRGSSPEAVALRHVHLPKLDESDLVDWDEEAGTVARGPRYAEVEPFLELLVRNQHELPGHLV